MNINISSKPAIFITNNQFQILAHRLEVPCAIADVLHDDYGYVKSRVEANVNQMLNDLENKSRLIDPEKLTPMQKHILEDCIESTTLLDMMEEAVDVDLTEKQYKSMKRVYSTLRNKFIKAGIIGND